MSTEQAIADLQTQAGLLLDLPQDIADVANQKIDSLTQRYDGLLASQNVEVFVNATTGNDSNEGTEASPLATIQAALALTPRGGHCTVNLTADYHVDADIAVTDKNLSIVGANGIKHRITFERYTFGTNPVYRVPRAFRFSGSAALAFFNITLVVPDNATFSNYALWEATIFAPINAEHYTTLNVSMLICDIEIPAQPFCPLFGASVTATFTARYLAYTGDITNPHGQLFTDAPSTTGTDVNTLPWLLSNLSTV